MLSKTLKEVTGHNLGSGTASAQSKFETTSDVSGIGTLIFYIWSSSNYGVTLTVEHNWESISYWSVIASWNHNFNNVILYKWDKITAQCWATVNTYPYSFTFNYKEFINTKIIKVFELKRISGKVNCYLLGRLPDGTRRDGN